MNLLMLNYEYPPLGGGAGNATCSLLQEFANFTDLNIDLITASCSQYQEEQFSSNIRIYRLDIGKNMRNLHHQTYKDLLSFTCKSYAVYKKMVKQKHYHLAHAFFGIPF